MKKDLLAKPKGKIIKLSDGKDYQLSPFNLNILADMEEAFDCDLQDMKAVLSGRTATAFRKLLHVLLAENYPELSIKDVGRLVEMKSVNDVISSLMESLTELDVE